MTIDPYDAAYAGLVGIMVLATLPLFFISCFMIPQRGDTARRGFIWLKSAFWFMFLSVLFITVDSIIIVILEGSSVDLTLNAEYTLDQVANQLSVLGNFFQEVSFVLLLFSLVDVGLGIFYCWDVLRGRRSTLQWITYGFGFIEVVLAFAIMIKYSVYYAALYAYFRDEVSTTPDSSQLPQFRRIIVAYDILMFIAAIAAVGFAIYILVLASRRPNLDHRQAAVLLLVASIIFVLPNLWSVVGDALWTLKTRRRPESTYIVDAIFSFWAQLVSLVLLFVIGLKKYGGLWSIPTNFAPPVQYYGYNGNVGYDGYSGQPMVQQPYPQQYGAPQQYAQQPPQTYQTHGPTELQQPDARHEMGYSTSNSAPSHARHSELGSSAPASELHSQTIKPY